MIRIPTISELYSNVLGDLEASYGNTTPPFGKNFLRALAAVQAAKLKLFYLAIGDVQKNIFVDTADTESSGGTLERFGRVKLGRNPFPPTAGQYQIGVTGSIGTQIKATTTFKSNDDSANPGKLYVLDSNVTLTSEAQNITVRALESGLDSKLQVGDRLSVTAPVAGLNTNAQVVSEAVQPLSGETIELYRRRTLEAFRQEPQGGAATDFRLWASDAQGVQQSYPYSKSGAAGEVDLYVEATFADSTDGKGTPSVATLVDVEAVVNFDPDTTKPLNERGRLPLGVFAVNYLPVTPLNVDIIIQGSSGISTAEISQISVAITEEVNSIRPFIAAADVLSERNDRISINKIVAVVLSTVPNAIFSDIIVNVNGVPVSTYIFDNGNIPYLRSVSNT